MRQDHPPQIAQAGDVELYTIDVNNLDSFTAPGVTVSFSIPSQLTVTSYVSSQGSFDTNTNIWTIGDLSSSNAEIVLTVLNNANDQSAAVVTTATITAPTLTNPAAGIAQVTLGLQRACNNQYRLLEVVRMGGPQIVSVPCGEWRMIDGNSYFAGVAYGPLGGSALAVIQNIQDTGPCFTLTDLVMSPTTINPTAVTWAISNNLHYVVVGAKLVGGTNALQVYGLDPLNLPAIALLQSISTSAIINTVANITVNNVLYILVGLATNQLALYRFDPTYGQELALLETITLDSNVTKVNAFSLYNDGLYTYIVAGLSTTTNSSNNPVWQLYLLDTTYPEYATLTLLQEHFSSVSGEATKCMDWTALYGTTYLATGSYQPIPSPYDPEVVRLYTLTGSGITARLNELSRVSTQYIDGCVNAVRWNGNLLAAGGNLGTRAYDYSIVPNQSLLLFGLNSSETSLTYLDAVSNVVLNGPVQTVTLHPDPTQNLWFVTGICTDNGTSGAQCARFYELCYGPYPSF